MNPAAEFQVNSCPYDFAVIRDVFHEHIARLAPGGMIFHVLNRGNARDQIFHKEADDLAFEKVMAETMEQVPMQIISYCLMPNHWHLALGPKHDGDLGRFMQRLTTTHARRWHLHRRTVGSGHLYQGTYKSFPIEGDEHLYTVLRYVERNPVRPTLVARAEELRWSSLWRCCTRPTRRTSRPYDRVRSIDRPIGSPASIAR